jgi:hypothetical protein
MEREHSMIVEFQLSLEGQAARWYAQQDISSFATFQALVTVRPNEARLAEKRAYIPARRQ